MSIAWRYLASALRCTYCIEMLGPAVSHSPRVLERQTVVTVAMCHDAWRQQLLFRDWSERRCYLQLRRPRDPGAPVEADVGITVDEIDCITAWLIRTSLLPSTASATRSWCASRGRRRYYRRRGQLYYVIPRRLYMAICLQPSVDCGTDNEAWDARKLGHLPTAIRLHRCLMWSSVMAWTLGNIPTSLGSNRVS